MSTETATSNATTKILDFINTTTQEYTANDVSSSTGVAVPQARTILRALQQQNRIELVGTKRTNLRGRPSSSFRTVR